MLKTRSLFPHYGRGLDGSHCSQFLIRMPDWSKTTEQMLRYWHGVGSTSDYYNYAINTVQGFEKFESTENYYQDNWCNHTKVRRVNLPYTTGVYVPRSYGWRLFMNVYCRWTWSNWNYPDTASIYAAHVDALGKVGDELRAEAYWDLRPKFEGEVSMLNFIYELKDFRDIAKLLSLNSNKNPLYRLLSTDITKALPRRLDWSLLSTPTKRLAEGHLINAFAIQPLISDLTAIFQQLHQMVDDAQAKFKESGAGTTRRWSKKLDPVANLTALSPQNGYKEHIGSSRASTFTAVAKMKYKYTPRSKFDAFCTYWGLVPTAEAVWNALPFSFLVDYFISVGKSLNRMRTDPNLSDYSINEYSESLLTSYTNGRYLSIAEVTEIGNVNMGLVIEEKYYLDPHAPVLIDGWEVSHYTRWLDAKPYCGPALPKLLAPKTSQWINMAALARCML